MFRLCVKIAGAFVAIVAATLFARVIGGDVAAMAVFCLGMTWFILKVGPLAFQE